MGFKKILSSAVFGLLFLGSLAQAQVLGDRGSELPLRVLHSPHFDVVFPAHLERVAQQSAAAAEKIRDRVLAAIGSDPGRTTILLNDETDLFNGYALASPEPFVRVFAAWPRPGDIGTQWQDLLVALIGHEFTHVAHLATRDDLRNLARSIFGSVPGLTDTRIPPAWLLEGLAVYLEGEVTTGGRSQDAATKTIRSQMLRGKRWPSFSDVSIGVLEKYPFGNARYVFGAGFVPFLVKSVGEAGISKALNTYNSSGWDFSDAWQQATGFSLQSLWFQFEAQEKIRAELEEKNLQATNLPQGERLVSGGSVAWRNDGALAYFASGAVHVRFPNNPEQKTNWPDNVALASRPQRLSFDANNNLVYSRFTAQEGRSSSEIFRLLPNGTEEHLTDGAHARDAVAFGECILYVREVALQSSLRKLCPNADTEIFRAPEDWHLMQPAPHRAQPVLHGTQRAPHGTQQPVSQDNKIALTVWRPGGFLDVAVLEDVGVSKDSKLKFITSDAQQDQWPTWNGDNIIFSSDRGGNFQLYATDQMAEQFTQLTAALGGALAASFRGPQLAFASQATEGGEVRLVNASANGFAALKIVAPLRAEPVAAQLNSNYPSEDYSPNLLPKFWYPFSDSGIGATIFGGDVAGIHQYRLSAGYALLNGLALRNPTGLEAGLFYRFSPLLDWNFDVVAHADPSSWYAGFAPRYLHQFEMGADAVKFGLRPYVQWDANGFVAGVSANLDALNRDVFGYATDGWLWAASVSSRGRYSSSFATMTDVAGQPLQLGFAAGGFNTNLGPASQIYANVGTRFTLRPSWRVADGGLGLERFTIEPFAFASMLHLWSSNQDAWDFGAGLRLVADNYAFYLSPGNLGVEIAYGSQSGFSINWILDLPLLGSLNAQPSFSPFGSQISLLDNNAHPFLVNPVKR